MNCLNRYALRKIRENNEIQRQKQREAEEEAEQEMINNMTEEEREIYLNQRKLEQQKNIEEFMRLLSLAQNPYNPYHI